MAEIQSFKFNKDSLKEIAKYKFGRNWPAVYLIEDGKEIYVGETISAYSRSRQHIENPERARLENIHLISDEEFNKSATLDIESWLIQYIAADGVFKLQNGNGGLRNHNYFDREKYRAKFELAWENLKKNGLVQQDLVQLKNTDLFKYSPYKSLSDDQLLIARNLVKQIKLRERRTYLVNGRPGTGKTILGIYLLKYLLERDETRDLKIALVIPQTSLRSSVQKVFTKIKGLKASMVIGPAEVIKHKYDLLIVDEAHRLKQRKNIPNYGPFDVVNKLLGLGNEGTELDWILGAAPQQILLYDKNQSVRPSDIPQQRFKDLDATEFELISQQRVEGGEEYLEFIANLFDAAGAVYKRDKYDFRVFDSAKALVNEIKARDSEHGLARTVAGYAWEWVTRHGAEFDIELDGLKLKWNSTTSDWVNSPNAVNEVGCIHTVQGYDLNYAGVIIGPELTYNETTKNFHVDTEKYKDMNGWRGVSDPNELERYVINIYKTLLTRGMKGTYVHAVDPGVQKLLMNSISD